MEGVAVVGIGKQTYLIDRDGLIFTDPAINLSPLISEGMVMAYSKSPLSSKVGFFTTDGEPVIDFKFDVTLGFHEGLALAHIDRKAGYIDKSGEWVIEPQFGPLSYSFSDGLAMVTVSEGEYKWNRGFIDHKGNFIIEPIYGYAESFSEGFAIVSLRGTEDPGQKCITTDGSVAFEVEGYADGGFSDGLLLVGLWEGGLSYYDKTGNRAFDSSFYNAHDFSEGLAAVLVSIEGYKYYTETGEVFDEEPEDLSGVRYKRPVGAKWGYIDKTGEVVIEPRFDYANEFHNGLAKVTVDDKWAYINKQGEYVWGPEEPGLEQLKSIKGQDKIITDSVKKTSGEQPGED